MDSGTDTIRRPLIEHIGELRTRLVWISLAVASAGGVAFAFHQDLLNIIQRPLHQTLYFTSPTGGVTFIFQLCLTVGVVGGFPVIVYNCYKFLSPMLARQKRLTIFLFITASFALACLGVTFAYFISLPAALVFLTQFGGDSIKSLITANEYFSFALAYLGGFAILFQIPLLILIVNKIKPLKPSSMLKNMRWIILVSFIIAALLTPTPDPINQTIMAAPMILLYLLSVIMVFFINRRRKFQTAVAAPLPHEIDEIVEADLVPAPTLAHVPALSQPKLAPPPQKLFLDIMTPAAAPSHNRARALRPQPALHYSRPRPTLSKSHTRPNPLMGRRAQSIDGMV